MTPTFMGSEPVRAETGKYAGTSVCQAEEAAGLALVNALSSDQRRRAILGDSILYDALPQGRLTQDNLIIGGAFQDNVDMPYEGIGAPDLTPGQRELLL